MNDVELVLITVYGPNQDDPEFYVQIFERVNEHSNPYKLIGGDFNLSLDLNLDRKGAVTDHKTGSRWVVSQFMNDYDMVDIWRLYHPEECQYTWFRKEPEVVASHLDFWLISGDLAPLCDSTGLLPCFVSDHLSIYITLKTNQQERGKGVWKLNNSLLDDENYVKLISDSID